MGKDSCGTVRKLAPAANPPEGRQRSAEQFQCVLSSLSACGRKPPVCGAGDATLLMCPMPPMAAAAAAAAAAADAPREHVKAPTVVMPCDHSGAGACSSMASVCWQGLVSRKADCTLHWPWV